LELRLFGLDLGFKRGSIIGAHHGPAIEVGVESPLLDGLVAKDDEVFGHWRSRYGG
jgi:hypothetical protein